MRNSLTARSSNGRTENNSLSAGPEGRGGDGTFVRTVVENRNRHARLDHVQGVREKSSGDERPRSRICNAARRIDSSGGASSASLPRNSIPSATNAKRSLPKPNRSIDAAPPVAASSSASRRDRTASANQSLRSVHSTAAAGSRSAPAATAPRRVQRFVKSARNLLTRGSLNQAQESLPSSRRAAL